VRREKMRKYVILFLIFSFSTFLLFSQEKREVSGRLEKITKNSITVDGKIYSLSDELVVKEKDGKIIKDEEEKLDLRLFRAVEKVKIVIVEEKVKEIVIELRRE
jgi:uncharacterized membrane protein affecting hemolysin expression